MRRFKGLLYDYVRKLFIASPYVSQLVGKMASIGLLLEDTGLLSYFNCMRGRGDNEGGNCRFLCCSKDRRRKKSTPLPWMKVCTNTGRIIYLRVLHVMNTSTLYEYILFIRKS